MLSEFLVTTQRRGSSMVVGCSGELDVATSGRLEEALSIALEQRPTQLVLDGRGISLLTSSGITTLFKLAQSCRRRAIRLELKLSQPARRILDLVGLWWLGVVDDGLAVEDALNDALRAYAQLASETRSPQSTGSNGSDYFWG